MAKKSGVEKRNGVYCIRYELPPVNGKRRQRREVCPGLNSKEAEALRARRILEVKQGIALEASTETVSEYLADYLEYCKPPRRAPKTYQSYELHIRRHINPALGGIRLICLQPAPIQECYDGLVKQGLSPKTIRNAHGVLHGALARAVRLQRIPRNPADYVELPRYIAPEVSTADPQDVTRLLTGLLDGHKYRIPALIALCTGMRRGEVIGLRWEDIDLDGATVMVRRSFSQVAGKVEEKDTKTGRTNLLPIPSLLVDILREYQRTQRGGNGWVCTDEGGELLTPLGFTTAWWRLRKEHNLSTTIHGLRHTQGTELLAAGVDLKTASQMLTHSNLRTTERYLHVVPTAMRKAADLKDEILRTRIAEKPAQSG